MRRKKIYEQEKRSGNPTFDAAFHELVSVCVALQCQYVQVAVGRDSIKTVLRRDFSPGDTQHESFTITANQRSGKLEFELRFGRCRKRWDVDLPSDLAEVS